MSVLRVASFSAPLVFVDIETNGLNHVRGRVIEVAAIRVEAGKVTQTFKSLIDPETELPQFISSLTGISSLDLVSAPTFHQIAPELHEILDGAIFVAHNVRFDYSFLKQEFSRLGMKFLPKQLCTVKLSRALYPHERGHKLQDLINRHQFKVAARHRAYDDAHVLWQFIQHLCKHFPPEQVETAIAQQIRSPSLPKNLNPNLVKNLPETTGVYIFEDAQGQALYVGKSINIKKRVLMHFGRDHAESKEFKIAQNIEHIRTHQTPGELSALLLESELVKQLQPVYNRQLRRAQKLLLLREHETDDGYTAVQMEEANGIEAENAHDILAVYTHRGKAKQAMEAAIKLHDLCPKLMGLENAAKGCFLHQLKKCRGACAGKEPAADYNIRVQIAFERQRIRTWPYGGAVLVEEKNASTYYALIVDQWCLLGHLKQEEYCEQVVEAKQKSFDLDTYKILQSFFTNKMDKLKIKPIASEQLKALFI